MLHRQVPDPSDPPQDGEYGWQADRLGREKLMCKIEIA
jgi:hypothetical protein